MNAILSLQKEIERELLNIRAAAPTPTSSKIEIPQGVKQFHFPDGTVQNGPFDAVILDWRWNNSYFTEIYNPSKKTKPLCFARGFDQKTMAPHPHAEQAQCDQCVMCPHNQWGSKGNGKACKNTCVIALVPPDATEDTRPITLTISPTGLKHWVAYMKKLTNQLGKIPVQLVTRIGFDPSTAYQSVLFAETGMNENLATCFALRQQAADVLDHKNQKDTEE